MPGVVYIQTVPPLFTVKKLREIMAKFGELGRVYLQGFRPKIRKIIFLPAEKHGPHRRKRYTEGWIEFKSKSIAKVIFHMFYKSNPQFPQEVAQRLNGQLVGAAGGKRRSAAFDSIWTMKYLHGFKWEHLMDQLAYEKRVEQQRLRTEIVQERKKAEHFSQQVEKGERLRQLEEKILKKNGLWERYQQQHEQKKVVDEAKKEKSRQTNKDESFLRMIFGEEEKMEGVEEAEEGMEVEEGKKTTLRRRNAVRRKKRPEGGKKEEDGAKLVPSSPPTAL